MMPDDPASPGEVAATSSEILHVLHGDRIVGELRVGPDGSMSFGYAASWCEDGFAISVSMPLADRSYAEAAHRFFVNLLPEGIVRQLIARRLGVSEGNDWELLKSLGGDCAGALALLVERRDSRHATYETLSFDQLRAITARRHPGLATMGGTEQLRLSLAGAQDKLPVRITREGDVQLAQGTAASTHLIKFASEDFAHLTANEVFVTWLAGRLDLPTVNVQLDTRFEPPLCVVERYDRVVDADGRVHRLHQEDFCQALGLSASRKYESEGGPDLARIQQVLDAHSSDPIGDIRSLLRWVAFCGLVGNADGHAKNLSLLYEGSTPRLAPFYDLICTRVYRGIARRLALSVGGESDPGQVGTAHWRSLGARLGVKPGFVVELVQEMAAALPAALEETVADFRSAYGDAPVLQMVVPSILRQARRSERLLSSG